MPTPIQWCDETFNPWWGCERLSPACAHCYADTLATRYGFGDTWGSEHGFRFFGDKHWAEPLKWARTLPAKLGRRPRVFCASMADVFEDRPELVNPRERLFDLVEATPELDWLILTKRPELVQGMLDDCDRALPANVWLGVSIENARFTWRADVLRKIPAAVRFISAEPLLGSLYPETFECPRCEGQRYDVGSCSLCANRGRLDERGTRDRMPLDLTGISWVIVGGESGPKARRSDPRWIREVLDACRRVDVAPFVKQLGAVLAREWGCADRKGGDIDEWLPGISVREFPRSAVPA